MFFKKIKFFPQRERKIFMTNLPNKFTLAAELKRDTIPLKTIGGNALSLCYLGLMNNQYFPWLILVPQEENLKEIIELSKPNQHQLMDEIALVSNHMQSIFSPEKLNVAALGNMVPQLHIHIIARNKNDKAWPNPVWGHAPIEPYNEAEKQKIIALIK